MPAARRSAAALLAAAIVVVGCAAESPRAADQEEDRGRALYQADCTTCHSGATGGDIADIPPRHNAEGHTWHHPDCELIDIIRNGMPRRPGLPDDAPTMPSFSDRLTEEEIRAILAHIKTWWTEQQRHYQAQVTNRACE